MAELVDALVSGTSAARRGGSSPLLGTKVGRYAKKPLVVIKPVAFLLAAPLGHTLFKTETSTPNHNSGMAKVVVVCSGLMVRIEMAGTAFSLHHLCGQIMTVGCDYFGRYKVANLEVFAGLLDWQQVDDAIHLRRFGVTATYAAFFAHADGFINQDRKSVV